VARHVYTARDVPLEAHCSWLAGSDFHQRRPPTNAASYQAIFAVTFNPDGRLLAWGDAEGVVHLWGKAMD
jgi:hypothetical protein